MAAIKCMEMYHNYTDATHLSSKSRKLHLPLSLPTFHMLLICWFPGIKVQTYLALKGTKPKTSKRGKGLNHSDWRKIEFCLPDHGKTLSYSG